MHQCYCVMYSTCGALYGDVGGWVRFEWHLMWGYNGMFVCCAGAARQCSKASRTVVSGYMHAKRYVAPVNPGLPGNTSFELTHFRFTPNTDRLEIISAFSRLRTQLLSLTFSKHIVL